MTLAEILAIIALVIVLCCAIGYIIYSKRKGRGCVGCPYSKDCSGSCSCKSREK